ncbi:MAG TPA: PIN domain-containing protein [Jatrophihabitans sp.]|nr:PIN domain-containing protein [Jatrophihabitans sp.]
MSADPRGPVVVDTGVFGARLTPAGHDLTFAYRAILEDRPAIISYVTVAELRFGATLAGWGTRRLQRLDEELARIETVWPGPNLTDVYVALRASCVRAGHGRGHKEHEADRWVAATALWLGVPLVSHDAIFKAVDRLELLTRLP